MCMRAAPFSAQVIHTWSFTAIFLYGILIKDSELSLVFATHW